MSVRCRLGIHKWKVKGYDFSDEDYNVLFMMCSRCGLSNFTEVNDLVELDVPKAQQSHRKPPTQPKELGK